MRRFVNVIAILLNCYPIIFGTFIKPLISVKTVVIITAFLLRFANAYCDDSELRFRHITTDKGLSSNSVTSVIQDNQGYMWIGTREGLNRFDGFNNTIFESILDDSTSLSSNMVYSVDIDHAGNIWVGTQTGLCLYNSDKENFRRYFLDKERINLNTANRVMGMVLDTDSNMYVATEIGSLYLYNRQSDAFINEGINCRNIKDFLIDSENHFWLGGIEGLSFYDKLQNKITFFDTYLENGIENPLNEVHTLLEEGDTIWIGTMKGSILYLLKEDMKIRTLEYDFEKPQFIFDIFKDSKGLMYFSTTDGMYVYDKEQNSSISYKYDDSNKYGINSLGITGVYEDMQGNLWLSTFQGGVNLAVSGKAFKNYNTYSKGITLDIENINAIKEDYQGNLWLGSFDLGVNYINLNTGKRRLFMNDADDLTSLGFGSVYTIFEDSKKNIWTGTYQGYLQKYNPSNSTFTSYPFSPEKGRDSQGFDVRSIAEDKDGNLWLIAHGQGLSKFNPYTRKFIHYKQDDNNLSSSLADDWGFQVLMDHENIIWVATPSGLSRFDPETEVFNNYYHSKKDSLSLCNNYVNVLFEDSKQNLWIGTAFGLNYFDRESEIFIPFYEEDGLPSNQIKSILEHKSGELWISTANGLSRMRYRFNPTTENLIAAFRNYNKSDNLQDVFFWERSAYKTSDGQLIFGCEKGIIMFDPDDITENTLKPNVYITRFKLFNRVVEVGDKNSLLSKNISETEEIRLKHNQNIISFEFVAINYIASENNQYAYKMEGFDEDWIQAGSKREVTYTNLDPDTYVFRVKASNNDGYWNEEGAAVTLIISPPFWETLWFRILAVLGFVSIIMSYYLFRIKILKNQNVLLEQRVQRRTHELSGLNTELLEKHNRILVQNEEILTQNKEIQNKTEEISVQKEMLEEQKGKVEKAYEELTQYRNKLEELVDNRTKELILAKEKAEESDQLKSSFLANLSHEIRTPLNSIIGFTGLFFDAEIKEEERQTFKSIIDSSSNTLLNLINDIIDFSKIEAQHLDLHIDDVFINSIFIELEKIYNLEIKRQRPDENKQIEFRIKIDKNIRSLIIKSDEIRLKQVLSNLINNAIKFTDQGYIEVGCELAKDNSQMLEFIVRDTGIGIKPEDQEIIFQRFRKVEDDRDYLYRGAGLGLTICQHLIQLLGGKIWVESAPDTGSIFRFSIPLDHATKSDVLDDFIQDVQDVPDFENKTFLIVEDDYANYSYLLRVLLKTNAAILHAQNGKQGVEIFMENPQINMILMDIKMPVMNGIDALKEMKNQGIKIPVIAQTAYAFSDEIRIIKDVGFDDFISKPIAAKDLYTLVLKHMKK